MPAYAGAIPDTMRKLLFTLLTFLVVFSASAVNDNIPKLISSSDWDAIFPNRAMAGHPQGATDDFYSYARFISAVNALSEYSVTFSAGPGGAGTAVAVSKTDGSSWTYVITSSSWVGDDYTVDYSTFCNTGDDYNDKRELAAFFANITKETTGGWQEPGSGTAGDHGKWGLYWLRELGPGGDATLKPTNCYTTGSTIDYSPAPGKCYYGRGPIQISYFYNYGNFSEFLYNNTSLVSNPDALEQDGELAFLSALWFWMTPQCPKPSCHQVMQEIYDESATSYSSALMAKKGFLHTVNIINGDVECRSTGNTKPLLRSKLYKHYMGLIGFTSSEIDNEDLGDYATLCNSGGTMVKYTSCDFQNVVVNNCSAPALGVDKELSGGTASLDANITLKDGETIAWYKDDVLISGATGTTYTATETGTYKAVVTGADCTKEDAIIISAEVFICSEPSLGKDKELVSGSTVLDANITLADGETIAWYKDDVLISGATGTTYTATEAGTYKAVTTRPGCNGEDEIIIYNEGEGPTCSKPNFGDDVELIGGSVTLNTNITALQDGESIAWYKDDVFIAWGATGLTYSATSVGTYKAVVTGADCVEEDEVLVQIICSTPDLGSDKSFTGDPVLLDAGITLKTGETIAWYKDGVQQWGFSGTTYSATALGTYKVVVSNGTACTSEDEVVVAETTCSTPDLGDGASLCVGSTITLDASVTLESGETLKWYKDDVEISGVSGTTYTVTTYGDYKAEVTKTDGCVRSDEVTIADGGSQKLEVTASDGGIFCASSFPSSVELTVTGGDGEYEFYDVATDGTPLSTGASFTVNDSYVAEGTTKTFYVQETGGEPVTVGATSAYESNVVWTDFSADFGWNDHRMVFNTLSDVTLQSIDFVFGYKAAGPYTLVVTVYEYGTNTVVESKTVELTSDIETSTWAPYPLNTAELGMELPAGNYEMSIIGSQFTVQVISQGASTDVGYSDPGYSVAGVAEIIGVNQPFQPGTYPGVITNLHVGMYNWVFVAGGAGACGRATVDVTEDCGITTDVSDVTTDVITVYPNPANEVVNIELGDLNPHNSVIELYNSVGQLVMAKNASSASENVTQIDARNLKAGIYFVKVVSEGIGYTTSVAITK